MAKTQLGKVVFPPKKYELIEAITLTEDTLAIVRDAEPDGTPYDFVKMLIIASVQYANSDDSGEYGYVIKDKDGVSQSYSALIGNGVGIGKRTAFARIWIENGVYMSETSLNASEYPAAYKGTTIQTNNNVFLHRDESSTVVKGLFFMDNIAYLQIKQNNDRLFAAGSEFYIYAVRN